MSTQKFYAHPANTFTWPNGAIGHRPNFPPYGIDTLGPYAKVRNCPIAGTDLRLTCYATGYPDTYFSVPAATKYKGKHVSGFFMIVDGNIEFQVSDHHKSRIGLGVK